MRDVTLPPGEEPNFKRAGEAMCAVAGVLWGSALVALFLVSANVSYTVCNGSLLQLPPPTVHIPPEAHGLEYLAILHGCALAAVGATVIGVFLVLYAARHLNPIRRGGWLIGSVAATLMAAGLLWLAGEYFSLNAHLQGVIHCL